MSGKKAIWVEPNGIDLKSGLRCALGNPFVQGSLYSEEPVLADWAAEAVPHACAMFSKMPSVTQADRDTADRLERNLKANRSSRELSPYFFSAAHRRLPEGGWRYKGLSGGRSSTKSVNVGDYLLLKAKVKPVRYLIIRHHASLIRDSVRQVFNDRAPVLGLGDFFDVKRDEVRGRNGSVFSFKGLDRDPEAVKSAQGLDGVWVEEAQKVAHEPFERLLPTIREAGAEIIFTFNRVSEDAPVDRFFYGEARENALLMESTYMDNPWLEWGQSRDILRDKERRPAHYMHHWGGLPQNDPDAQVIKNWRIPEGEELEALEDEIRRTDRLSPVYGMDIGTSAPTAMAEFFVLPPVGENEAPRLFVTRERYQSGVLSADLASFLYGDAPHSQWQNRHGYEGLPDALPYPLMVDSAAADAILSLQELGIDAQGAKKPGVKEQITRLGEFDILIHPRCKNAIMEARNYAYTIDKATGGPTQKLADGYDHFWDALRYGLDGYFRDVFPNYKLGPWMGYGEAGSPVEMPEGAYGRTYD